MKKTLIILWTIIIGGSIFIYLNGKSTAVPNPAPVSQSSTETTPSTTNKSFSQYYEQGNLAFTREDYSVAIKNYSLASAANPQSKESLQKLGLSYLKHNEPEKALTIFEKIRTATPNDGENLLNIVQANLDSRNVEKAAQELKNIQDDTPEVNFYRGIMAIMSKNYDLAQTIFTSIAAKSSEGDQSKITEYANKFLDKFNLYASFKEGNPIFLQAILAQALIDSEQYNASIRFLYDVIKQENGYRDAWIMLGYSYLKTNKINDAIDALSQAENLAPDKPETLFYLGLAYAAKNDIDKAIFYLEKSKKNGYTHPDEIDLKLNKLYPLKEANTN